VIVLVIVLSDGILGILFDDLTCIDFDDLHRSKIFYSRFVFWPWESLILVIFGKERLSSSLYGKKKDMIAYT